MSPLMFHDLADIPQKSLKDQFRSFLRENKKNIYWLEAIELGFCFPSILQLANQWLKRLTMINEESLSWEDVVWKTQFIERIQFLNQRIQIDQTHLLNKLIAYCKQYPQSPYLSRHRKLIESLEEGHCNAFEILVAYACYLQHQPYDPSKGPRDDWTWLYGALCLLSTWNEHEGIIRGEKRLFTPQEILDIERFLSLLKEKQEPHLVYEKVAQNDLEHLVVDTRGREYKCHYTLAGSFTEEDLEQIVIELLAAPYPKAEAKESKADPDDFLHFAIGSHDHGVNILKKDDMLFYDPNNFGGPIPTSEKSLAFLIFLAFITSQYHPETPSPMFIKVYGFDACPSFPKQEDLLKKTKIVRENKTNSAETKYAAGYNPLHMAVIIGCLPSTRFWVKQGISIEAKNNDGATAEVYAEMFSRKSISKYFLEEKWQKTKDPSLLSSAYRQGGVDWIRSLLQKGFDTHTQDKLLKVTLLCPTNKYDDVELLNLAVEYKANLDVRNEIGHSALHLAVMNGNTAFAAALLNAGAYPNVQTSHVGDTALHIAATKLDIKSIELLWEYKADSHCLNFHDMRPSECIYSGYPDREQERFELLKRFVERDPSIVDYSRLKKYRFTDPEPLLFILEKIGNFKDHESKGNDSILFHYNLKDIALLRVLLEHGANVNAFDGQMTPLQFAAAHGHLDAVRLFLEFKADTEKLSSNNETALEIAVRNGEFDVVEVLLQHYVSHSDKTKPLSMAKLIQLVYKEIHLIACREEMIGILKKYLVPCQSGRTSALGIFEVVAVSNHDKVLLNRGPGNIP